MLKIVITGPECCGKTTLSRALSDEIAAAWVPELARPYLSIYSGKYEYQDLLTLAQGQLALENIAQGLQKKALVLDTSILVLKIWSWVQFGRVDAQIESRFAQSRDLYFLCKPLNRWVPDRLRENPGDRWSLFYLYHKALVDTQKEFIILEGSQADRLQQALKKLAFYLPK